MRLLINKIILALSIISALIGLSFLGWILITLFIKGLTAMSASLFINDLVDNGLRNLIVGQFILAGLASVIGIPLGMVAGIYLREYGSGSNILNLSEI